MTKTIDGILKPKGKSMPCPGHWVHNFQADERGRLLASDTLSGPLRWVTVTLDNK